MENRYDWYLYKFRVNDAQFYFFPSTEFPSNGFSSVYAITEESAKEVVERGTTAQFKGSVCSSHLIMDFDDEEAGLQARGRLRAEGIAHEVYHTGNRGCHIYIPRPHLPSLFLPQIDKGWVKANYPNADLGLYTPMHLIRVIGAIHDKTGHKKKLIESVPGKELIIQEQARTPERYISHKKYDYFTNSIFDNSFIMNLSVPLENGHRTTLLIKLAAAMRQIGEPVDFVARWLQHVNNLSSDPLPQRELDNIIKFAEGIGEDV